MLQLVKIVNYLRNRIAHAYLAIELLVDYYVNVLVYCGGYDCARAVLPVERRDVIMPEEKRKILGENLMMLYTGKQRKSAEIHGRQMKETGSKVELYRQMKDLAASLSDSLSKGRIEDTGKLLHENWLLKRQLASGISDESIDAMYKSAMESGATGGKLLGAGGGGFLLFYADKERHNHIKDALGLRIEPFRFESAGSRIVHVGE